MTFHEDGDDADRVVVIGGGLAGLATALKLAPLPVTLLTSSPLGQEASTAWAQGGIAAALGPDDNPDLHADDTVSAGAGLVDPGIAGRVAAEAPACVDDLVRLGVPFDRDENGRLSLGMEGAHSARRIVRVGGDGSGRAILDALIQGVGATPSVKVMERARADTLMVTEGTVAGVVAERDGRRFTIRARAVVLATGGIGGLYASTTNPLGTRGGGLALAARAGARIRDGEFVQFHPTAMDLGRDPMPLASEALRGEGARLIDAHGASIMSGIAGGELAARDVVARAIDAALRQGRRVFLDAGGALGSALPDRFPRVTAACRAAGLDPVSRPIPVRPAAHFHMGGVAVDGRGRSSLDGLWACGEVAATGLHGANRLASNSLLEALAFARWIAEDIKSTSARAGISDSEPMWPALQGAGAPSPERMTALRRIMDRDVGVIREADGLSSAVAALHREAFARNRPQAERDAALVGLMVAAASLARPESRGGHFRGDAPRPDPAWRQSRLYDLTEICRMAESLDPGVAAAAAGA